MIRPEDDTRSFWIFSPERCGHVIGVLTDEGFTRTKAYREVYGGVKKANEAIDAGVQAKLVDAADYHGLYVKRLQEGCTCPPS